MKYFDPKNFYEAINFNFSIARSFGYFYFPTKLEGTAKKQSDWCKFSVFLVLGCVASLKGASLNISQFTKSVIVHMGIQILMTLTFTMPTVFRIFNFAVRHRQERIIANIQSIDNELTKLGVVVNYRKHLRISIAVTCSYLLLLFVTFSVDNELTAKYLEVEGFDALSKVCAVCSVVSYLSYQLCHMMLVYSIYKRMQLLNRVLIVENLNRIETALKIGRIQIKIAETVDLLNRTFVPNFLNYFCQFINFCLFYFFGIYHFLTSPDATFTEMVFNVIASFYWIYFFWFGAFMVTVSAWINAESAEFRMLLHNVTRTTTRAKKVLNNIRLQLHHIDPAISCGLFRVDLPYLFIFVSSLFSYLVILVQFESG